MEQQLENGTAKPARSKLFSPKNLIFILLAMILPLGVIVLDRSIEDGVSFYNQHLVNIGPGHWTVILFKWFIYLMWPSLLFFGFVSARPRAKAIAFGFFVLVWGPTMMFVSLIVGMAIDNVYP